MEFSRNKFTTLKTHHQADLNRGEIHNGSIYHEFHHNHEIHHQHEVHHSDTHHTETQLIKIYSNNIRYKLNNTYLLNVTIIHHREHQVEKVCIDSKLLSLQL
jgi:hypothetical protein